MNLTIQRLWDGTPTPRRDHVALSLAAGHGHLVLSVDAPYYGDLAPPYPVGSTPGLWNHEVVEWFLVGAGEPVPYLEVELSPHGHYLALRLEGVRNPVETHADLEFTPHIVGDRWRGTALIPLDWMPPGSHRHNAFAIHGEGVERTYSAAFPVPGSGPDFHRLAHFGPFSCPPFQEGAQ